MEKRQHKGKEGQEEDKKCPIHDTRIPGKDHLNATVMRLPARKEKKYVQLKSERREVSVCCPREETEDDIANEPSSSRREASLYLWPVWMYSVAMRSVSEAGASLAGCRGDLSCKGLRRSHVKPSTCSQRSTRCDSHTAVSLKFYSLLLFFHSRSRSIPHDHSPQEKMTFHHLALSKGRWREGGDGFLTLWRLSHLGKADFAPILFEQVT